MMNYLKKQYTAYKKRGFTLIELIVVMAVIAVLVLLAAPRFIGQTEEARDTNIQNDVKVAEMKVSEALIDGKGVFDGWSDGKSFDDLKGLASEGKLYGRGGPLIGSEVEEEDYKELPDKFIKRDVRSRLSGHFYANANGTVYYENETARPREESDKDNDSEQAGDGTIMGVTWDRGSDPTMERTHASVGKVANIGIGDETPRNDFDNMPIYKDIKRVKDEYGNVFVKIPKFYISKTSNDDEYSVRISEVKHDDTYYLPAVFEDFETGKELDYFLYGAYEGSLDSDNKLASKRGRSPLAMRTIVLFRSYATNNNVNGQSGYQQNDIHAIDVLQALFRVEFATLNSQSVHPGLTSGSKTNTGATDDVAASSGAMGTSGAYAFNYRGIENPWGNVSEWVDGVNINDRQAWVARDASHYESNQFDGPHYEYIGYENATSNGYVSKMGYNSGYPFAEFPTAVSGSSSTHHSDYYWQSSGQRVARFGGDWSNGSLAGMSYWSLGYSASNTFSNVGGRLLKKPL